MPRTTAASKVGDHNKFSSLSKTTVVAIFQICVYGDIVFSQTWEVLTQKNCIELPLTITTAFRDETKLLAKETL